MSDNPGLSLPARAPSMARYHDEPMTLHPAALYTLVDLADAELGDLERECEAACVDTGSEWGTSVRLASQPRFVGQPLRSVFDYHLELGQQTKFEPKYFIVAVDKAWRSKGVILVTIDADELDCNVDSFRIKAVNSGLTVVNIQIGNSSWAEEKEGHEFHPDNRDSDDDDVDDDLGPPVPTENIPLGYYIPIYINSSLSEDKVIADLEPAFKYKSPEEFACRIQAKLTPASSASHTTPTQDLIQQAATLHPMRCAKNQYLHKAHILVIDTADPVETACQIGKELALTTSELVKRPGQGPESIGWSYDEDVSRFPWFCR
ncbi:hypothetical protein MGN70_008573 [Eutypa lata]|nr:hypothetical protein MGN70_008573 [Eutypa lata]